jgi:hypothetical protein
MADNSVFITGVADGAFEKALGSLPEWATQDTSEKIQEILNKTLKLQTNAFKELVKSAGGAGGLSAADAKRFSNSLDDASKILDDERKQHPKDKKFWKDSDDEHNKLRKRWKEWGSNYPALMASLELMKVAGNAIGKVFESNIDTYTKMNAAGINTVSGLNGAASGFQGLQQLTALTGVRFTELSASMITFATAINAFGMGKFAKTVGMSSKGLAEFGYSSKEAAELLGEYLTVQQGISDSSHKSAEETASDLTRFASNINKLSLATGMQRSEILKNLAALSKGVDANVLQGQTGTAAANSTLEFISSIKDAQFGKTLLKMMTDQIKPLNQTFSSFQKIGQGGFGQKLMAFTQSLKGMDPESARQAMKTFEEQNRAQIEYGKQQANLYSQIPELAGDAQKALETYNGLQQTARETVRVSEEDLAKLKETNKARAGLASAWEKLLSSLQKAFAPTVGMLNILTAGLNILNGVIDALLSVIPDGALAWAGAITVIVAAVAGFGLFTTSMSLAVKALGFFTNKLIGGGKKGSSSDVAEGLAGRASGGRLRDAKGKFMKAAPGGKESSALSTLGKGISDIAKGAGKAVTDILKGIANGIKAFGSTQVLKGVLAMAGIAASLWILSKALVQFNSVEWESLAKAGVAIVGLTLAVLGLGAIMSSGAGAAAIVLGAAALALMGASLWLLGAGIQSIGSGFEMLGKGIESLSDINGMQILGITAALVGLGIGLTFATPFLIAGSLGLLALGAASLIAGPGLALLASGLKGLSDISGIQIAGIALGLGALALSILAISPALLLAAIPLTAFGVAAAIAAVPIALLAWGLKSLLEISAGSLLAVAGSLTIFGIALSFASPFLIAGSFSLVAIGAAALLATPGLLGISLAFKIMSGAISTLSGVGFAGLVGVGTGIAIMSAALAVALPFMLIASVGLLALGAAALIATPGIIGVGYGLKLMGEGMQAFAGIGFTDMLGVAGGLTALGAAAGLASVGLLLGAPGLLLFGAAALVAGPGIKSLAEGLAILEPLTGANLSKLAKGLDALTSVAKIKLIGFGIAALAAGPGIKSLAEGLTPLDDIDGFNLFAVAMGINGLSSVNAIGLLALGMIGKKVGLDIQSLAYGLYSLGLIDGKNLIKVALGIDTLSNVSALGLLALGMVGKKVGLDIQALAYGLFSLALVDGNSLIRVSKGITALTDISAMALLAFGLAAGVAAPGITALASGLEPLENLDSESLTSIALGITALTDISAMALLAFGLAAGVAAPGITALASGLVPLSDIDVESLIGIALGITTLTDISAMALLAFGLAAGVAGSGIQILATSLTSLAPGLETSADAFISLSAGLSTLSESLNTFTGLDTLKSIVATINGIDIVKALAFGALGLGSVSLPPPTPTTGVSPTSSPKPSTLDSPSTVSTKAEETSDQAKPKEQTKASGAGNEKAAPDSSINTALGYQSSLLEQILLSTNNMVSVNKDILKYARVQA